VTIVPEAAELSASRRRGKKFDRFIGRLLIAVTYLAVALLSAGVVLLFANGISPLAGGPPLDLGRVAADLAALAPAAFLWLGILAVIATPLSRVIAAAVGFARLGDRWMVGVAVAILVVIALGIVTAVVAGS
jgi:uncharacterized membrane protein